MTVARDELCSGGCGNRISIRFVHPFCNRCLTQMIASMKRMVRA